MGYGAWLFTTLVLCQFIWGREQMALCTWGRGLKIFENWNYIIFGKSLFYSFVLQTKLVKTSCKDCTERLNLLTILKARGHIKYCNLIWRVEVKPNLRDSLVQSKNLVKKCPRLKCWAVWMPASLSNVYCFLMTEEDL
jgi:hypothetical protein